MNDSPIPEIMLLRMNILPPYCCDDDEGDKSDEDYYAYYKEHIKDSRETTDEYINAWKNYISNTDSDDLYSELLFARSRFITNFPFSYDELDSNSNEFLEALRKFYEKESKVDNLTVNLEKYRSALDKIL
jgi:hypothetical protein